MAGFDSLDRLFEKGFRVRQQNGAKTAQSKSRDARRVSGGGSPAPRGGVKSSASAKLANAKAVIRKAPEVVVKITGSSSGLKTLKSHLEYISRNGELELENELGESINGLKEIKDLRKQFENAQVPHESNRREFLHVMFSMPNGTPEKELRASVAAFCKEEFSNRHYVMAFHGDTDKPHVHVAVSTRDIDRVDELRLSPRKADLNRWRSGFAEKLRENDIEAAASDRGTRFNFRRPEKAAIRQIRAENPSSSVFNEKRYRNQSPTGGMDGGKTARIGATSAAQGARVPKTYQKLKTELEAAIAVGERPTNPLHDQIESKRLEKLAAWQNLAADLSKTGNAEDRELSKMIADLVKRGSQEPVSRNQALFDAAVNDKNKNKAVKEIDHHL